MLKLVFSLSLFLGLFVFRSIPVMAASPDSALNGNWHFVLDTPGGDREMNATFQVTDAKVTGKFGKDDVAGTFTDNKINLSFPVTAEETGEKGIFKLTGKLDNDELKGDWSFSDYNGAFKATHAR